MHSIHIAHRDLKPENIMLEFSENKKEVSLVKLIDFGFSHSFTPETIFKDSIGTPNYVGLSIIFILFIYY